MLRPPASPRRGSHHSLLGAVGKETITTFNLASDTITWLRFVTLLYRHCPEFPLLQIEELASPPESINEGWLGLHFAYSFATGQFRVVDREKGLQIWLRPDIFRTVHTRRFTLRPLVPPSWHSEESGIFSALSFMPGEVNEAFLQEGTQEGVLSDVTAVPAALLTTGRVEQS